MKLELVATVLGLIISIMAIVVSIQTKNEWKVEKRYESFKTYYEKLEDQASSIFQILGSIRNFKIQNINFKRNPKNFMIFKTQLGNICLKYIDTSTAVNKDSFVLFMDKSTLDAESEMRNNEKDFASVLDLQNWNDYKDVKFSEIEVKAQKLLDSIIKVETTAAKSIKKHENIKF